MAIYLDSSVLLRHVLREPDPLQGLERFDRRITSNLTEVECLRVLDRLRLRNAFSETELVIRRAALFAILEAVDLLDITRAVLQRAADTFPVAIGTLDAIHLSTALLWQNERGEDLIMGTHDETLGKAAKALRMKVLGH